MELSITPVAAGGSGSAGGNQTYSLNMLITNTVCIKFKEKMIDLDDDDLQMSPEELKTLDRMLQRKCLTMEIAYPPDTFCRQPRNIPSPPSH